MEVEDYLQEPILQFAMDDNDSIEKPWQKSNSATAKAADNIDDCFQCNICLDHANEPVVTLCGHLYCWPCIYKWLHFRPTSTTTTTLDQQPQGCPVCKANVSLSMVVPLYGRGGSLVKSESNNEKSFYPGLEIPNRPLPAHGVHPVITNSSHTSTSGGQAHDSQLELQPNHHPQEQYNPILHNQTSTAVYPMFNSLGGSTTTTAAVHQIVGMLGEMVYARIFGNGSEMGLFVHPNSSYYLMGINNASPRLRRQEMKAGKSLNRISIFLFCCLVLCLLSF